MTKVKIVAIRENLCYLVHIVMKYLKWTKNFFCQIYIFSNKVLSDKVTFIPVSTTCFSVIKKVLELLL